MFHSAVLILFLYCLHIVRILFLYWGYKNNMRTICKQYKNNIRTAVLSTYYPPVGWVAGLFFNRWELITLFCHFTEWVYLCSVKMRRSVRAKYFDMNILPWLNAPPAPGRTVTKREPRAIRGLSRNCDAPIRRQLQAIGTQRSEKACRRRASQETCHVQVRNHAPFASKGGRHLFSHLPVSFTHSFFDKNI